MSLEFFASAACDASGNGEGEIYLGSKEVITDANGDVSFTASLSVGIAEGYQQVTATATDPAGSTSEFSACVEAVVTPPEPAAVDALYVYDGDGNMVKSVIDGVATYYAGGHYEVQEDGVDTTVRKYYATGLQKVAVRTQVNSDPSTVNWLLGDHLGSTSLVANADGTLNSQIKYTAFGEIRSQSGTSPTDYLYTGQRQEAELGLYYYVARWYDPAIGRFIQADTIVPNPANAKAFDRYAYTYNNPLNYTDPSGHEIFCSRLGLANGGSATLFNMMLLIPDCRGINVAKKHVTKGSTTLGVSNTAVAAGIATQSEYYSPLVDKHGSIGDNLNPSESSGYGIAQIADEQAIALGFNPGDQDDPANAVLMMGYKLFLVIYAMENRFSNLQPEDY